MWFRLALKHKNEITFIFALSVVGLPSEKGTFVNAFYIGDLFYFCLIWSFFVLFIYFFHVVPIGCLLFYFNSASRLLYLTHITSTHTKWPPRILFSTM